MDSHEVSSAYTSILVAVSWIIKCVYVLGGVVPYIPQYLEIKRSQSTEGFSMYVCLALLIANTLRILFWFGHPFEITLLLQSILMIGAMMVMVHLCVRVHQRSQLVLRKERTFAEFDWQFFWDWSDYQSYVEFIVSFATFSALALYIFLSSSIFVEGLGFVALLTESLLGVPQFYKNFRIKSTAGMSKKMVLMWLCGDVFKTTYFKVTGSPIQFLVCGALQIGIDVAIIGQCFLYRKSIQL